jgi:hypothetical protein
MQARRRVTTDRSGGYVVCGWQMATPNWVARPLPPLDRVRRIVAVVMAKRTVADQFVEILLAAGVRRM